MKLFKKTWERIGGYNYGHSDMARVPKWVSDALVSLETSHGEVYELKGRNYRYRIESLGQGGPIINIYRRPRSGKSSSSKSHGKGKRNRATAVVMRDGKYLVVLDKGKHHYSLPGGGIEKGETAIAAAVREVFEETGLNAIRAEYLFEYSGATANHKVFRVEVQTRDKVKLQKRELDDYKWWNGRDKLAINAHVEDILARVQGVK